MNSDFSELLSVLGRHRVRYLVVGGWAVIHYAEPRYTKDPGQNYLTTRQRTAPRWLCCSSVEYVQYTPSSRLALAAQLVTWRRDNFGQGPKDLDIFVDAQITNCLRLKRALEEFAGPLPELSVEDLADPHKVIMMGRPPTRVDLLKSIDGVRFETAWKIVGESSLARQLSTSSRDET